MLERPSLAKRPSSDTRNLDRRITGGALPILPQPFSKCGVRKRRPFFNQQPQRKETPMKTIVRYQSQLLPRRSYKPGRRIRITFRPSPIGVAPVENVGKTRIQLPALKSTRASPN
jgi:hypothetical protein